MGPCMCGDTHCSSCGPAQGNWKCPICRVWADDGCEHITDAGIKPEFQAEAAEIEKAQWLADNQFAADIVEEERLAAEYWNSLDANGRKK